eukprot:symbB.v1.2.030740.t1/scaffold3498.1/size55317/2
MAGVPRNRWTRTARGAATPPNVILWLRNELRLRDNPLLQKGLEHVAQGATSLQMVVCLNPEEYEGRSSGGSPKVGELRKRFVQQCLQDLQRSVAQRGSRLLVRKQAPEEFLPTLATENTVVLVTGQVCSEERAAETRVANALQRSGATLQVLPAAGISDLVGPYELATVAVPSASQFPVNFHHFFQPLRPRLLEICDEGLSDAPSRLPPPLLDDDEDEDMKETATSEIQGGETAAWQRMESWLDSGLHRYKHTFRRLQGDYSSKLSPHLAYGCISPRRLVKEVLLRSTRPSPHVDHFVYEMCWRDFFRHTAARWGNEIFHVKGPAGLAILWRRDPEAERRWKEGSTGVPLVDAAMRELRSTGYIGNLARQFVAAYLIEDLQIDWRVGADWFEATLVDYDVHSNWGQWARSAGVVPTTDAKRNRVGGTRYYDLAMQCPEVKDYVRHWLPELKDLNEEELFAPWTSPEAISGYTKPLVSSKLKQYFESATSRPSKGGKGKGRGRK